MLKNKTTHERRGDQGTDFAELANQFEVPGPDEQVLVFAHGDTLGFSKITIFSQK